MSKKKQPKFFEDFFEVGTYDTMGKARRVKATKERAKYSWVNRYEVRKARKRNPSGSLKGGFTLWSVSRVKNVFYKEK